MHNRIGRFTLLGASLLLSLIVAELLLRALPDHALGFHYDPARDLFAQPSEYEDHNRKNTLGYHDVEHGPARAGERRVLLLGDSYVEGRWAPRHLTLGPRMARYLRETTGEAWDVIAVGKGGWSQREQLTALREYGPAIQPNRVITVVLTLNDVGDNLRAIRDQVEIQVRAGDLVFRPGWLRRSADEMPLLLVRSSLLNQLVSYRIASSVWLGVGVGRSPDSIPLHYFVYAKRDDPLWERAWAETERLLVATRDEARALGASHAVVSVSTPHGIRGVQQGLDWLVSSYPAMSDFEWDLDGPDRRLREISLRNGIAFLALEPVYREATARGEQLHWPYDGHWNHEGTDMAARLMARFVLEAMGQRGSSANSRQLD